MNNEQLPRTICLPGFLIVTLALLLASCEKPATVELNDSPAQIVIQGFITNRPGPYQITVSRTGDYTDPTLTYPPVSNCLVTIADGQGTTDTLVEKTAGEYYTRKLQGVPGRTYKLRVVSDGKEYTAVSQMPFPVAIDSLVVTQAQQIDGSRGYTVDVLFRDPPEAGNYYRIDCHTKVGLGDFARWWQFLLYSDEIANGRSVSFRTTIANSAYLGDSLTVDLFSIDPPAYEYYSTMNNLLSSAQTPTPVAPINPSSNIKSGALGYFSAFSVSSLGVVLR